MKLTVLKTTFLKKSNQPSDQLDASRKSSLEANQELQLQRCEPTNDKHWKVTLKAPLLGQYDWFAFAEHVQISDDGKPIEWKLNAEDLSEAPTGRHINQAGLELLKSFEGCRLTAYRCPAKVPTIGYGTTENVKMGTSITQTQAEAFLKRDLNKFEQAVIRAVKVSMTDNQFSALVSLTYNIGIKGFQGSSVLRNLNKSDQVGAANSILKWNRVGRHEMPGLTRRRIAERALFLKR